jgi:hypothetical protein
MTAPALPSVGSGSAPVVLLAMGATAVAVGFLVLLLGATAFGVPAPFSSYLGPLVVLAGALGLGGGVAISRGRVPQEVASVLPRLYPYGGAVQSLGIFLVAVVSAAAVVSAIFAEYTGALAGGDPSAVPRPEVLNALYLAASALLWIFAVWILRLLAQVIRLGRALDRARGRNVYGAVADDDVPIRLPSSGPIPPPAPPHLRRVVASVTVVLALGAMAAIQVVETGGDPPAPLMWLALELLTPVWALGLAYALLGIDRYVRDLEQRYAGMAAKGALGAPAPSRSSGTPGFVP